MRGAFPGSVKPSHLTLQTEDNFIGRKITRSEFLERRNKILSASHISIRPRCLTCRQPVLSCICSYVKSFDPQIRYIILIHPLENNRRIATGRIAHLCLKNSELILGCDYSENKRVNEIINNPENCCYALFPSQDAIRIDQKTETKLFPEGKSKVIFVIDGTWRTARKTLYLSSNLSRLPKICFTPRKPSNFRVRIQPKPGFVSTIEAVHEVIELTAQDCGFNTASKAHDNLLFVFDTLVDQQLAYLKDREERKIPSRMPE